MEGKEVNSGDTTDSKVTAIENIDDLQVESVDARPSNNRLGKIFGVTRTWLERKFFNRTVASNDILDRKGLASVAKMPAEMNADYYNFNHPKRGSAIIFNHESFEVDNQPRRKGTNVDRDNLQDTLKELGFEVFVYNNLTCSEIISTISEVAGNSHSDCDCLLVVMLSHGKNNIVYAKDGHYDPETVWTHFTADRCPSLAGKPKLFIIQACRGEKYDHGITLSRTEVDGGSYTYRIPTQADFLIAYSTIPGYFSWRNEVKGSWFIQALCSILKSHGREHDILTLLTFVSQRVAIDFESYNAEMHKKQIPCTITMLTRLLRFNEK